MNLRERLRLLHAAGAATGTAGAASGANAGPAADPTNAAGQPAATRAGGTGLPAGLGPGTLLDTPAGAVCCLETAYPLQHRHGCMPVADVLAVPGTGWARVGRHPAWEAFNPAGAAFLDTETTNLERSQGNYIFLAGVGRFVDGQFRVRQFFMRDYHEQEAVLHAVLAELAGASAVVTFNGKGFDWPVLTARCTVARLRVPQVPHLDLLHPARRLWGAVAPSCRLVDLEATVLGEPRTDDVPGHLAPALYQQWLRTGEAAPLAGVVRHNRRDIVALAALAAYLGHAAADPLTIAPGARPLPPAELLALGRQLLADGERAGGIACLEAALARGLPEPLRTRGLRLLGTAYKRAAQHERAAAVWLDLARETSTNPWPHIELAKHHEHRTRDLPAALTAARHALAILERRRRLAGLRADPALERELQAVRHRLDRLQSRLRRRSQKDATAPPAPGTAPGE